MKHLNHVGASRPLSAMFHLLLIVALALGASAGCAKSAKSTADPAASLLPTITQRGTINIGVRTDDPPHGYLDTTGKWVGFDIDIATALAQDLGVKVNLVKVDELTRISYLQNGRIDLAIASISETQKRAQQVDFSETYFFSTKAFLVKKGGSIASLKDLAGKTVGADKGSNAPAQWNQWLSQNGGGSNANVVMFSDKHAAAAAVAQGTVAGWMEDYEIVASFAKSDPSVQVLTSSFGVKQDAIAMHKNDSALMLAVNLALQKIATSGQYDQFYDHWFGPASTTPVPRQGSIEVWPNA